MHIIVVLFSSKGAERTVDILCGSLKLTRKESYRPIMESDTKFEVVMGYVAGGISFRHIVTAMLMSSITGQV